jgi:hypothetical protein
MISGTGKTAAEVSGSLVCGRTAPLAPKAAWAMGSSLGAADPIWNTLRVSSVFGLFNQVRAPFYAGILVRHDILVTAGKRYANPVYWEPGGVYTNAPTS